MSQRRRIGADSTDTLVREAIARHCFVAVSCRAVDGWSGFDSRFLAEAAPGESLLIEYPSRDGNYLPEVVPGQTLGLSFRRGAKRCVFSAIVLGTQRARIDGVEAPAVLVSWPSDVFELQRRLDYRAPIATTDMILVATSRQLNPHTPPEPERTARLLDLSAGGLSLGFSAPDYPCWEAGDLVICSFTVPHCEEPFDLVARIRYANLTRDMLRVGVQWFGLETTETGRAMLDRVTDLCAHYQQLEMQRLGLLANTFTN